MMSFQYGRRDCASYFVDGMPLSDSCWHLYDAYTITITVPRTFVWGAVALPRSSFSPIGSRIGFPIYSPIADSIRDRTSDNDRSKSPDANTKTYINPLLAGAFAGVSYYGAGGSLRA